MSKRRNHYDCIVIGSGQSGTPLASSFANAGRKTVLIERAHIGGCCVNEGCTPTKTMIASGRVAYLSRRAADYGVHFGAPVREEKVLPLISRPGVVRALSRIGMDGEEESGGEAEGASTPRVEGPGQADGDVRADMRKVRQRKRDIVESFREGGEKRLVAAGVEVLRGEARFVSEKSVAVELREGEEVQVQADLIFINTGERPSRPDLKGLNELDPTRVLDSTTIQELGEVPRHLIVLGGGYIGLEFGQLFRRLGAEVTIVQRGPQLLPREDSDVAECMLDILREDGIAVHLSTTATRVFHTKGDITLHTHNRDGFDSAVTGSHILLAAGRTPNTDMLDLQVAGVATMGSKGHISVDERLETSVPGIYAMGDVKGGSAFTHVSYDDFRIIRDNLLSSPSPSASASAGGAFSSQPHTTASRASTTPYVVYTDPQLAHVGQHEHELRRSDAKIKVAKMPMSYVARALETDEPRGMMKAVVSAENGQILGFTCLGIEGGEVMAVVQMAMVGRVDWQRLQDMVFAHPSLAESLNNIWGFLE